MDQSLKTESCMKYKPHLLAFQSTSKNEQEALGQLLNPKGLAVNFHSQSIMIQYTNHLDTTSQTQLMANIPVQYTTCPEATCGKSQSTTTNHCKHI